MFGAYQPGALSLFLNPSAPVPQDISAPKVVEVVAPVAEVKGKNKLKKEKRMAAATLAAEAALRSPATATAATTSDDTTTTTSDSKANKKAKKHSNKSSATTTTTDSDSADTATPAAAAATTTGGVTVATEEKKKRRRRVGEIVDEDDEFDEPDFSDDENPDNADEDGSETKGISRAARTRANEQDDRLPRTLFVGNIPVATKKEDLIKHFKDCGEIESVRFRSISFANPKVPRRGAFIMQQFHKERDSMNAYIVFEEEESVAKALLLNGSEFLGKHIRCDAAGAAKEHDNSRSIFIGNLPFNAKEEEIRDLLSQCGDIENVRLVRDAVNNIGKGIGFVQFKEASSVKKALTFNTSKFGDRELRITRAVDKATLARSQARGGKGGKGGKQGTGKGATGSAKGSKKLTGAAARIAKKQKTSGGSGGAPPAGGHAWEGERAAANDAEGLKRLKQKLTGAKKASVKPTTLSKKTTGRGTHLAAKKKKVLKAERGPSKKDGAKAAMMKRTSKKGGGKKPSTKK